MKVHWKQRKRVKFFLERNHKWNEWITIKPLDAYVRSTERYNPRIGLRIRTLELANITVHKENEGWAGWFLDMLELHRGDRHVLVENAHAPAMKHIVEKRGYVSQGNLYWQTNSGLSLRMEKDK